VACIQYNILLFQSQTDRCEYHIVSLALSEVSLQRFDCSSNTNTVFHQLSIAFTWLSGFWSPLLQTYCRVYQWNSF